MKNNNNYLGKSLLIVVLCSLGATILYAWTGPSSSPPDFNAPVPVNVGSIPQLKLGDLSINGIMTILGDFSVSGKSYFLNDVTFSGKTYAPSTSNLDTGTTLTTKDYVDANAGGGGWLSVYTTEGAPVGKLLRLHNETSPYVTSDNGDYIEYVDPTTLTAKNIKPADREIPSSFYYRTSGCTGTKYMSASYGPGGTNWVNEQSYHDKDTGKYYIVEQTTSCSTGGSSIYYHWNFNTNSCVSNFTVPSVENNCLYGPFTPAKIKREKLCGSADCTFK